MKYRRFGRTGWQVSLNNPAVSTIIPGMRKVRNVEANVAAGDRGPLPQDLHSKLRARRWDRTPTAWSQ